MIDVHAPAWAPVQGGIGESESWRGWIRGGAGVDARHVQPVNATTGVAGAGASGMSDRHRCRHGRGAVGGSQDGVYAAALPGAKEAARGGDSEAVQEIVDGLNQVLKAADKRLQFLVHDTTGRIYVKVIDKQTDEVIKEIPPEKILDLVGRIQELVGLLVDEKV